ncbi:KGK domain-containing protein [Nodularia sp. UHCC 0506]|uniref:KGK domain-containing protein n=1 Tax=Nodularia sp. UHCC 0506 TaxID=3110243 RepID=UPI002B1EC3C2|nr:KGK domain-containing protein [Nodularia sp. UHCC 0506]MEA5515852.1 KGK domain-containing protein [Nodularia sp. UHCC 0506]
MENGFERLNHDEVVYVKPDIFNNLDVSGTFKVHDLISAIKQYLGAEGTTEESLYSQGLDCEVLKFSAEGWKKGKVRLSLEFCPDEPEFPLEEIYQQLEKMQSQS